MEVSDEWAHIRSVACILSKPSYVCQWMLFSCTFPYVYTNFLLFLFFLCYHLNGMMCIVRLSNQLFEQEQKQKYCFISEVHIIRLLQCHFFFFYVMPHAHAMKMALPFDICTKSISSERQFCISMLRLIHFHRLHHTHFTTITLC